MPPVSSVAAESASVVAWRNRWRALRPEAIYHHEFGLESAWRDNMTAPPGTSPAWGYPLSDLEETVSVNGQDRASRTFSNVGLVYWDGTAAAILGWPK